MLTHYKLPFPAQVADEESTRCRRKATALFVLLSVKETVTGVLLPLLDMGTDIATATTHFLWGQVSVMELLLMGLFNSFSLTLTKQKSLDKVRKTKFVILEGFWGKIDTLESYTNIYIIDGS